METNLKRKIPFGKKLGYSFGGATDTLAYDFVAMFLLFFMTDMAGIDPAIAGMIISLGVIWDVITDPIIGALADKTHTRFGRKRTWLLVAIPSILISYCLLFTDFGLEGGTQTAYFIIMSMAFWTGYTCFSIPYYSMGASMTMDNDERTKIRMLGQIIQYVGVFFSSVAPTLLVTVLLNSGMDTYHAWHYTAWVVAAMCVGTLIVVFISTKGIELDIETKQEEKRANFFKEAIEALKIKPYLILVLMNIFYRVGYCAAITLMTYFILYSCGLSTVQMSVATFVISFGGIAFVAVLMKFVGRFDKIKMFVVLNIIAGIAMISCHFVNISSLIGVLILLCFYLLGSSCYWSMNMPMMYDTVEVDEFQSGYRKEGTMFSIYLCVQKVGYAIAASVIGQVLARVGYDDTLGAANPEPVLNAISAMFCIVPGICMIAAALIMLAYPLKADVYEKLYAQLEKKRAGEEYNTEGFAHVLSKKYR